MISKQKNITILLIASFTFFNLTSAQLIMPVVDKAEIEAKIKKYFPNAPIMVEIARCETGLRHYDENFQAIRGGKGGNHIGLFQLAEAHAVNAQKLGMDIYTLEGNLAFARHLYNAQGTGPWVVCTKTSSAVKNQAASVGSLAALTSNLKIGMVSEQVLTLQKLLNAAGFIIASTGPGSPGQETNIFGSLTREALKKFQCAKNVVCSGDELTTGFGRLGPKTRAALLAI